MKIKQGWMPPSMRPLFGGFLSRYGLADYSDQDEPAVFFGCYNREFASRIAAHRGRVLMVWLGSDILNNGTRPIWRRKAEQIKHLALGPYLAKDLERLGIPYQRYNLVGSNLLAGLKAVPLGAAVYAYCPTRRDAFFGGPMIRKVRALLPDVPFIIRRDASRAQETMPDLYAGCFAGLRCTEHDGGAETVVEMGLMGRRCVYRGDHPNAIGYKTAADIVAAIRKEQKNVGRTQHKVARETKSFIETGNDWLEMERWW